MISIIISSYKAHLFTQLAQNIADTIGVPYEIVKIDNPGLMGICEAYNKGAELAQYDILCFCHEDIFFRFAGWGRQLADFIHTTPDAGFAGVAGSTIKLARPTGWFSGIAGCDITPAGIHDTKPPNLVEETIPVKVKVIDGVIMCSHKCVWQQFPFNEHIKGFHFYDIDISMRVAKKYQNYLLPWLSIHHFSQGKFDDKWIEANFAFHQYAKRHQYIFSEECDNMAPVQNFWYERLTKEEISLMNKLRFAFRMGISKKSALTYLKFLKG